MTKYHCECGEQLKVKHTKRPIPNPFESPKYGPQKETVVTLKICGNCEDKNTAVGYDKHCEHCKDGKYDKKSTELINIAIKKEGVLTLKIGI